MGIIDLMKHYAFTSISILDPKGNQLVIYDCTNNKQIDMRVLESDKKDKLTNSLRDLSSTLDMTLSLLIGAIENEINTNVKYEK